MKQQQQQDTQNDQNKENTMVPRKNYTLGTSSTTTKPQQQHEAVET